MRASPLSTVLTPAVVGWLCVLVVLAGWAWMRLGRAAEQDLQATTHLTTMIHDLDRLRTLRAGEHALAHGKRPEADLITRAQRALADAGLPVSVCSGVQPRADQVTPAGGVHVQTVQLTLKVLRPQELGSWLAAWSSTEQPWRVSDLQLVHAGIQTPGTAGTDSNSLDSNRFDVSVVLSAPYVEEAP
jgi:hypothetical protein